MVKQQVTVMRGPPGSGKSTLAERLCVEATARGEESYVVSADKYFTNALTGVYSFDVSKLSEAHKWCMRMFIYSLQDKVANVIVDNTNINIEDIAPYVAVGEALGAEVTVMQIEPPDYYIAANRNIHGVPQKKVLDMARWMSQQRLPKRWKSIVIKVQ